MRGGVAGLFTNSHSPSIGNAINAINDNGNWRESRAGRGLGLAFALVVIGGNGSWWTMAKRARRGVVYHGSELPVSCRFKSCPGRSAFGSGRNRDKSSSCCGRFRGDASRPS